jgi:hypothetical protein
MIGIRARFEVGYTNVARRIASDLIESLNVQPHSPKWHRVEAIWRTEEALRDARGIELFISLKT